MNPKQAGICAVALLAAAMLLPLPERGAVAGLPSICPSWRLFDIPCLFCGMTRSFIYSGHGKLAEAFAYHPLGPLLFGATAIFVVLSFWRRDWRPSPRLTKFGSITLGLALCVAWLLRLGGFWPLPAS